MGKRKKYRTDETEDRLLVQYIGIIIFMLSIAYIVIVTNPPAELLEYNENLGGMVTRQLSYQEFSNYRTSLLPFLALFTLIMFFSGYLSGVILIREAGKKITVTAIPYVFTLISITVLGYMLIPYYGFDLALVAFGLGLPAYATGAMSEKSMAFRLLAFIVWIIIALLTGIFTNLSIGLVILLGGVIITLAVEIPHFLGQKK